MSTPCCTPKPAPRLRHLDTLTTVYGALADATRLRILSLLKDGEVCVCHLHGSLGVPQPTASRHLAYLRRTRSRHGAPRRHLDALLAGAAVRPGGGRRSSRAALHALTHTEVASKDLLRLQRELVAG